jgi:hypothetical protein
MSINGWNGWGQSREYPRGTLDLASYCSQLPFPHTAGFAPSFAVIRLAVIPRTWKNWVAYLVIFYINFLSAGLFKPEL